MDDGEVLDLADHAQAPQPGALLVAEVAAGPHQGGGGHRVHLVERVGAGGVLVVVALDHRAAHVAHPLEAAVRVGVVADHVAKADVAVAALLFGILEHGIEGLVIGMNVTEQRDPHDGQGAGAELVPRRRRVSSETSAAKPQRPGAGADPASGRRSPGGTSSRCWSQRRAGSTPSWGRALSERS